MGHLQHSMCTWSYYCTGSSRNTLEVFGTADTCAGLGVIFFIMLPNLLYGSEAGTLKVLMPLVTSAFKEY